MKRCPKCKTDKPLTEYGKNPRNGDGLQGYCRTCNLEMNRKSKLRHEGRYYQRDGFLTEEDHFNYALRQYAKAFDMPQLLKYQTNTGSIQRYDRNAKPF